MLFILPDSLKDPAVKVKKLNKLCKVFSKIDPSLFKEFMEDAKNLKFEDIDLSKYSKFTKIATIEDVDKFFPIWCIKYTTAYGIRSLAEYQHEHKCW